MSMHYHRMEFLKGYLDKGATALPDADLSTELSFLQPILIPFCSTQLT